MGLGTTAILYAGPFFVMGLDKELPGQRNFDFKRDVKGKWDNVWGLRNYVIVSQGSCSAEEGVRSRRRGGQADATAFSGPLDGGGHLQRMYSSDLAGSRCKHKDSRLCNAAVLWHW